MDAAGWIVAGYAAIVSTASLAWQVWSWHLARSNRVTVVVKAALLTLDNGELVDAVSVEVINRSDHPVRVTGVGLFLQDGSGRQMHQMEMPPGATLPGPVASRDSGSTFFLAEDIAKKQDRCLQGDYCVGPPIDRGDDQIEGDGHPLAELNPLRGNTLKEARMPELVVTILASRADHGAALDGIVNASDWAVADEVALAG